jgi:hypothetical protein
MKRQPTVFITVLILILTMMVLEADTRNNQTPRMTQTSAQK